MTFSIPELLMLLVAAVAAVIVLRPYVPAWAWFAVNIAAVFYGLAVIVDEGSSARRIGFVLFFAGFAAHIWWFDLRKRSRRADEEQAREAARRARDRPSTGP